MSVFWVSPAIQGGMEVGRVEDRHCAVWLKAVNAAAARKTQATYEDPALHRRVL